jgi:hypothetical protein
MISVRVTSDTFKNKQLKIDENIGEKERYAYRACILFDICFYDPADCKNANLFILIVI